MPARPLRMLSLCSGIGGIDYAWSHVLGQEIAGQVEIDDFCNAVLAQHWPDVPRMRDIREVHGDEFGSVDLVAGGIPCQPWSVAGQQRGTRDDRHLWPAMRRIVQTIRPAWVLIENVAGFAALALDDVCTDLEFLFYEVTAYMVPAAAVEAPHLRERIFVVAHANEQRRQQESRSAPRHEASASWRPIQERATLRHHVAAGNGEGTGVGLADAQCPELYRQRESDSQSLKGGQLEARRQPHRRSANVADTAGTRPQGQERAESPVCRDAERCGGEGMAHAKRIGRQRGASEQGGNVLHWQAPQRQQGQRDAGDGHAHDGQRGQAQSRLGREPYGLSAWLDGHRWPAGPTEAQHEWEAPRTITGSIPNRAHRLKALGNAVVPAQVAPILASIIEAHWTA